MIWEKIEKKEYLKKNEKGFVILFAMVIAMTITLIASGLYTTSKKQTILSSYAKESQIAFYAANSALECALYHDLSPYNNQQGSAFPVSAQGSYSQTIQCGGKDILVQKLANPTGNTANYPHSFFFRYPDLITEDPDAIRSGCAFVLVEKKVLDDGNGGKKIQARITAVGYNTCKENPDNADNVDIPDFDDPRLLERRISSAYENPYYGNVNPD